MSRSLLCSQLRGKTVRKQKAALAKQLFAGRCCRNGDVLLASELEEALLLFPSALEN